jgi:Lar family restriction alleviation protein
MDELKPCPFCGSKPSKVRQHIVGGLAVAYYTVECEAGNSKCFIKPKTKFFRSKEEAIEAWNRRAETDGGNHD